MILRSSSPYCIESDVARRCAANPTERGRDSEEGTASMPNPSFRRNTADTPMPLGHKETRGSNELLYDPCVFRKTAVFVSLAPTSNSKVVQRCRLPVSLAESQSTESRTNGNGLGATGRMVLTTTESSQCQPVNMGDNESSFELKRLGPKTVVFGLKVTSPCPSGAACLVFC